MKVLTAATSDRAEIAAALSDSARVVVVSLCAAWCDTCGEFRAAFERLALSRPQTTFVWLDIEDDAEIAGDVDVENFPTLAIYRGREVLHFGVSVPQETTVGRLVDALADQGPALRDPPDEVVALADTLRG